MFSFLVMFMLWLCQLIDYKKADGGQVLDEFQASDVMAVVLGNFQLKLDKWTVFQTPAGRLYAEVLYMASAAELFCRHPVRRCTGMEDYHGADAVNYDISSLKKRW